MQLHAGGEANDELVFADVQKALDVFAERAERVFVVRGGHAVYDDIRIEIEHFNVEAHDVFVQHLLCDVKIADEPPGKILNPLVFLCVFLQKRFFYDAVFDEGGGDVARHGHGDKAVFRRERMIRFIRHHVKMRVRVF